MSTPIRSLCTRRSIAASIALITIFAGLLYLEARPWWCKYGIGLWSAAWRHCTSQQFLDPYALTHVLHGIIFFWLLYPFTAKMALHWRLVAALTLEIGWELLENSPWVVDRYRQTTAALDYTGDSIINAVGDVAATLVGFIFASHASWKAAVAAFIVVELSLLFFIRDNLTLNLIMLFLSPDWLKEWQLTGIAN